MLVALVAAHTGQATWARVRTLFLLRHAKSSWADPTVGDHDRSLAPRGRRAARCIADHLKRPRLAIAAIGCGRPASSARPGPLHKADVRNPKRIEAIGH